MSEILTAARVAQLRTGSPVGNGPPGWTLAEVQSLCDTIDALRTRLAEVESERDELAQTTGDLCPVCGWRGIRSDDGCAFCAQEHAAGHCDPEWVVGRRMLDAAIIQRDLARAAEESSRAQLTEQRDAAIARLAEVESERDVETALKRDLEEARDDWCADCKSVDFANADASEAFANERAATARAEAAEKRADEAEKWLAWEEVSKGRVFANQQKAERERNAAESDATELREVLAEVMDYCGEDVRAYAGGDLYERATALAAGPKEGK